VSATVLYMSMSLDGFIAGPNAGRANGLGDGGNRLHEWVWSDPPVGCRVFRVGTAQLALAAGVLDELEIHLILVLLGQGATFSTTSGTSTSSLSAPGVLEGDAVTHLHYRVQR
jgi:hypothetical protein